MHVCLQTDCTCDDYKVPAQKCHQPAAYGPCFRTGRDLSTTAALTRHCSYDWTSPLSIFYAPGQVMKRVKTPPHFEAIIDASKPLGPALQDRWGAWDLRVKEASRWLSHHGYGWLVFNIALD